MRTKAFPPVAVGLLALAGTFLAGSAASATAPTAAPAPAAAPAAAQASTAASPDSELRFADRGEIFEQVNRGGDPAAGSVAIYYGWRFVVTGTWGTNLSHVYASGFGLIGKSNKVARVQVDRVAFGDSTQALSATSRPSNSTTPNGTYTSATALTPPVDIVNPSGCSDNYRVRVYFSVRWADGAVSSFSRLGPLDGDCRGEH